jgi:RHH-type proline utilization regulon transcriptional repressor/proline dehydrogenase/delta 1-pyrroline-5-carboxylate dehydrogenase
MGILGEQFVMGRTIEEARYRHSFDMLGEAARTAGDATHYQERHLEAIAAVSQAADGCVPSCCRGSWSWPWGRSS